VSLQVRVYDAIPYQQPDARPRRVVLSLIRPTWRAGFTEAAKAWFGTPEAEAPASRSIRRNNSALIRASARSNRGRTRTL
jgi:hypothetical protein